MHLIQRISPRFDRARGRGRDEGIWHSGSLGYRRLCCRGLRRPYRLRRLYAGR